MVSRRRDDIILKLGPTRGALTVYPYQVGVIICDGIVEYVFEEEKRTLPKGEVRTYIVSTAPFKLLFRLKVPWALFEPDDIVLDHPLLTADGQHVTGRIDLTVSVITQGSMFASVMPEGAHRLLQLLGLDRDIVTKSDVANLIKEEFPPKLLALDFSGFSADELESNRDLLRDISGSLKTELASKIDRFGLQLDDFYANWGTMHGEHQWSVTRDTEEEVERQTAFSSPVHSELADRQSNRRRQAHQVRTPLDNSKSDKTPKIPSRLKTHTPSKSLNRKPSPLYQAAKKGYTDLVKVLVSKGADANKMTEGRFTPLHAAAMRGHTKTVQVLISYGADTNVMTKSGGLTPLDYATHNGHAETIQVLVTAQTNIAERLETSDPKAGRGSRSSPSAKPVYKQTRAQNPKPQQRSRLSQTRRQPASKGTTNRSTVCMSVIQRLSVSGLFNDGRRLQSSNHKVFFQVRGWRGATIFVTHDESEFLIREGALQNNKFPNNEKLYDFVRSNAHGTVRGKWRPTNDFRLRSEYIEEIIELIRSGLPNAPKARQASRPSQTRSKRSVNKSTINMTVLDKL